MNTTRVAVYRVGQEMALEEIPAGLESYQGIVGGYIEEAVLAYDLLLICNENGIAMKLRPNRIYRFFNGEEGLVFGDFFVCRLCDGEYVGLTDDDIGRLPTIIDGITESTIKILRMSRN